VFGDALVRIKVPDPLALQNFVGAGCGAAGAVGARVFFSINAIATRICDCCCGAEPSEP